jgi:hypothetical protein
MTPTPEMPRLRPRVAALLAHHRLGFKAGEDSDYLAIVNLGTGEDRTDFRLWDAPEAFTRRLLAFVGGREIGSRLEKWNVAAEAALRGAGDLLGF